MSSNKSQTLDRTALDSPTRFAVCIGLLLSFVMTGCAAPRNPVSPAAANALVQQNCEGCGAADAPASLSWRTEIAPAGEPGERLVMSGTIYEPDGRTPAKDILLYVYHTNVGGVYPKSTPNNGRESWRHGYLRGWMRTGADGKYEFHTIRPMPYPNGNVPAHIHGSLSATGLPEYFIADFIFEGDQFITEQERSRLREGRALSSIISLRKDEKGVLRGVRDITLKR